MLRALVERGVTPSVVAGTSAGAVSATWYALNQNLDTLESIWLALRTRDIFPGSRLRIVSNFVRHGHVHAAHAWERFLRSHFGAATFGDLRISAPIVAVDLWDGTVTAFEDGEIVPALMATTAIPGVFPPCEYRGRVYVDGGVLQHLPVAPFIARPVDTVYALDCSYLLPAAPRGLSLIDRCQRIAARANADAGSAALVARGIHVHLIRPPLPEIDDARSFGQTAHLIETGYTFTSMYLDGLESRQQAVGVH